jgi:hypothetical protein
LSQIALHNITRAMNSTVVSGQLVCREPVFGK